MHEVLKNHHLLGQLDLSLSIKYSPGQISGSTLGSHQDLLDATAFLSDHRIVPVVTHVLEGLEQTEEGFDLIRKGNQFGKVVINIASIPSAAQQQKL